MSATRLSSAATTSGAARKVMRGSPIAWCMASRKAASTSPAGRAASAAGAIFLAAAKRQTGGFGAHSFDFGMALVQRGAQRDHQRGDGRARCASAARTWAACVPSASRLGAHRLEFLGGQGLLLARARGLGHDDRCCPRNSVSKVNLRDSVLVISRSARLRRCRRRS